MEIEVLEKDDKNMRLLIRGVDVPYMNALRRTVIAEVPCMAIDEIVVIENSSTFQDEVIAHRLGLIPLKTDLEGYNLPEECPCKSEFGCNLCRVTLALDVESKEKTRTVYSGELESENPSIIPVSDTIPIIKLAKEQKLKLEAYARLGKGKNHAKWQPVSMCTHKYFPKIEISCKKCDGCGKCVEICPRKVLAKTGNRIEIRDLMACTLCQDCVETCPQNPPAVKITWEENAFIFALESTCVLSPEKIMTEAIKILDGQLKDLERQIKVKKSEKD
ncbi:MAG: DNA-directed RNA polymerase subunit D [Candidatus Bathyarchaeota archaeon]|nr:DNA-directed RNA polymerase subunit D [Candidatus Bathyarchaeota archaeon]MDH5786685.1 DNA-directed RNA polymerase subunit D [Candidatus Bathyarchaeota archaeon]